jgi:crossover junction endodeoxyribonuclease RusA
MKYQVRRRYRAKPSTAPAKLPAPVRHEDGSLTICLPMPPASISPNARRGESRGAAIAKSKVVKAYRTLAHLMFFNALLSLELGTAVFTGYKLAFFFRTRAFRDDDNADASCKAYRDGIAQALGMDDKVLRKCALSTHAHDPECPRVEITLVP